MKYRIENSGYPIEKGRELDSGEVSDKQVVETKDTLEDFEDCAIRDVEINKCNETSYEMRKFPEEDFDDCRVEKETDRSTDAAELEEEDFSDCYRDKGEKVEVPSMEIEDNFMRDNSNIETVGKDVVDNINNSDEQKPAVIENEYMEWSEGHNLDDSVCLSDRKGLEEIDNPVEQEQFVDIDLQERQQYINSEMGKKFEDILAEEPGSEKYKELLAEYNTLKEQKENIDNIANSYNKQIVQLEEIQIDNVENGAELLGYASERDSPKVLVRDRDDLIASGLRAVEQRMEVRTDDLRNEGIYDDSTIESIISREREMAQIEFYDDAFGKVDEKCVLALDNLSDYFSENGWSSISEQQRADALNMLAIKAGEAYRTEIKGVKFFDTPPSARGYYSGDGYLYINSDCLTDVQNRKDAIDTIFHEGRHAFQRAAINNPAAYGIDSVTAAKWKDNFEHYLSVEKFGYERYFTQPVEADAFSFASYVIGNGGI